MIVRLEAELSKLSDIKKNIKEMGASLWQGSTFKGITRAWFKNAGKGFLARYKKGWRSYKGK